jgi:hypothetical protein
MVTKDNSIAHILGEDDSSAESLPRRPHTVGTRLSPEEVRQLTAIADERQAKVGDIVRELILEEITRKMSPPRPDPLLAEIVGVRLLLVNLLRPRDEHDALTTETFDLLVDEIKRVKKQVATELEQKEEVW